MGSREYPSRAMWSRMAGSASGVWRAALWNSTMLPGESLEVTRWQMVSAS